MDQELIIVTGAFGYSGYYITKRLLSMGKKVKTLVGRMNRVNPFGEHIEVMSYNFDNPAALVENLRGATTLINTYWIRFPRKNITFKKAIENSKLLIESASKAGIRKIVQISITNPSEESRLPYFHGKAVIEKTIIQSGLSYTILRPAVIFGDEGILINNIAWLLRRMPVFAIIGKGDYKLQPIYVEDLAELAVQVAQNLNKEIIDAVGPEIFVYEDLVKLIARIIQSKALVIHLPAWMVYYTSKLLDILVKDVMLTRDEIDGLMNNLLVSDKPPSGHTWLSEWLSAHAETIGASYLSEIKKHY